MPTTNYHTVNGSLVGSTTSGTTTSYLSDALGSIVGLFANNDVSNTYRYTPYGDFLSVREPEPRPAFLWTGDSGSRRTELKYSDQYNRNRHYGTTQAQWTTIDPIWRGVAPYQYAGGTPTNFIDPSGLIHVYVNSFISRDMKPRKAVVLCDGSISPDWIPIPLNLGAVIAVRGDKRSHFEDGTSRIKTYFFVDECQIGKLSGVHFNVKSDDTHGLIPKYLGETNLCVKHIIDQPTPRGSARVVRQYATQLKGYSRIYMQYSGKDPLVPHAPAIRMMIVLDFFIDYCTGSGSVSGVIASHSRFPWHEGFFRMKGSPQKVPFFSFTPLVQDFLQLMLPSVESTIRGASFDVGPCKSCKCSS